MERYTIEINGYGSELTIGKLTQEQKIKILSTNDELFEIIHNDEFFGKHWSEIDDIYHNFNLGDSFTITIKDSKNNEVYSLQSYDILHNDESPIPVEYEDKYFTSDEPCLVCCSQEKGLFFSSYIETENFDISKLKLIIHEDSGLHGSYIYGDMIGSIIYDDEVLDNYGGDTVGKSFDVKVNFDTCKD